MLQTFQALFRALRTAGTAEARSLARVLYFYILSGYFLSAVQAAVPNYHNFVVILGFAIIGANAFQLFRISRLIRLTATGEALELARIIPTEQGITANKLIGMYWDIAVQLFIFMTGFCLLVPHLPLQREWWLAIAWPTLFVLVGILFGTLGRIFLRIVSGVMLLFVIATVLCATFPQIDAQLHLGGILNRILTGELADQVNVISKLRQQQREAQIKNDLEEVRIWVEEHPNTPYPNDYKRFLKNVSNGTKKTLSEVRAEILREKENPLPELSPKEEGGEDGGILEPYPLGSSGKAEVESRYRAKKNGVYFPTNKDILHNIYLGGLLLWNCPADGVYKISLSGFYLKKSFNKKNPDRVPVAGLTGWGNGWDKKIFPEKNYGAVILAIDNRIVEPGEYFIKAGQKIFIRFNFAEENPAEYFWNGQPVVLDYPENRLTLSIRLMRIE